MLKIDCVSAIHIKTFHGSPVAIKTPTVGLEPTTTRLRALRSADWARRAMCKGYIRSTCNANTYEISAHHSCLFKSFVVKVQERLLALACYTCIDAITLYNIMLFGMHNMSWHNAWRMLAASSHTDFLFVMKIHHLSVIHIYTLLGSPHAKTKHPPWGSNPRPQG